MYIVVGLTVSIVVGLIVYIVVWIYGVHCGWTYNVNCGLDLRCSLWLDVGRVQDYTLARKTVQVGCIHVWIVIADVIPSLINGNMQ